MKNNICKDIGESAYFHYRNDEHVDMLVAYEDMINLPKNEHQRKFALYKDILRGYKKKLHLYGRVFIHPPVTFGLLNFGDYNHNEYMTVCLTKHFGKGKPDVNFVTDAYNVNNALEILKEERGYIAARFVFQNEFTPNALIALAEEPAIDSPFSKQKIMELYRQMRSVYKSGKLHFFEIFRLITGTIPITECLPQRIPNTEKDAHHTISSNFLRVN